MSASPCGACAYKHARTSVCACVPTSVCACVPTLNRDFHVCLESNLSFKQLVCHLCPASWSRDGHYGMLEDSPGRPQVLMKVTADAIMKKEGRQRRTEGSWAGLALECIQTSQKSMKKPSRALKCHQIPGVLISLSIICTGKAAPWPSPVSFIILLLFFITEE